MDERKNPLVLILGVMGTLFFIAFGMGLLSFQIGCFLGIACYIVAGAVKQLGKG